MPRMIDLPCEVILIILNYLPSRDLWQNVRLTCRFFAAIIADQSYWKRKLQVGFILKKPMVLMKYSLYRVLCSCYIFRDL